MLTRKMQFRLAHTWQNDPYLNNLVESITRQTAAEFKNLSNTLAYKIDDKTLPLRRMYTKVVDKAIYEVQSGTVDYYTAMRKSIKQLTNNMRVLEWESGTVRRVDSHIRQNLLDGIRQLNQQMLDYHGERFGSDGVELSAHAISAPDHAPIQGRQFDNEQFFRMQNQMSFEDINGNKHPAMPRRIGEWNCKHVSFPIIIGISKPVHSEEQLKEFEKNSKEKYDLTQEQRRMENKLRKLKNERLLASASGDELEAKRIQRKINEQQTTYRKFSEEHNLYYDRKRATVEGYRRISAVDKTKNSGIFKDVNLNHINITQETIDNIPFVDISILDNATSINLQNRHKEILTIAKKLPPNTEVGFICDMNGTRIDKKIGPLGKGNVKLPSPNIPHITIHSHPDGNIFSHSDLRQFISSPNMLIMSVVGNNGNVYCLSKTIDFDGFSIYQLYNRLENDLIPLIQSRDADGYINAIEKFIQEADKYGVKFDK